MGTEVEGAAIERGKGSEEELPIGFRGLGGAGPSFLSWGSPGRLPGGGGQGPSRCRADSRLSRSPRPSTAALARSPRPAVLMLHRKL